MPALPAVVLLPVADLLVVLLMVVLPVVLMVQVVVGLLVGLLALPKVLAVSGVAVVKRVGPLPKCFCC